MGGWGGEALSHHVAHQWCCQAEVQTSTYGACRGSWGEGNASMEVERTRVSCVQDGG